MNQSHTEIATALNFRVARIAALIIASFALVNGCGTTTTRTATEQLLMSDAVDQAISQIDFKHLSGKKVFVDTLYLHSVKGVGFVNSEYIISSLRQQLTAAQCLIQDTRESADVIVEPRVGALGTDGHEVVYGVPQSGSIASAASMFSNSPIPPIPEVSVGKRHAHSGIAKVIVFAYDRETREPIWQSGIAKAESTSSNTWFLGAGPFQKGTIYEGMRFAGQQLPPTPHFDGLAKGNSAANVFPRLKSESKSEAIKDLDPGIELESISPEPMVEYKREHVFDPGQPLVAIPAAAHPDEIAASSDSEADTGIEQASFEEEVKTSSH